MKELRQRLPPRQRLWKKDIFAERAGQGEDAVF
jgi:hypothetical protein